MHGVFLSSAALSKEMTLTNSFPMSLARGFRKLVDIVYCEGMRLNIIANLYRLACPQGMG